VIRTSVNGLTLPFDQITWNSSYWDGTVSGLELVVKQEREQWFDGAFTYYLRPDKGIVDSMLRKLQLADASFGVAPTPENLYNASPWTWLADWFANAGDVVSNVSDMLVYGLVLRYGYMMEKSTYTYSLRALPGCNTNAKIPVTPELEWKRTIKRRVRATPFGFGLDSANLSAKQTAILAALGITRV